MKILNFLFLLIISTFFFACSIKNLNLEGYSQAEMKELYFEIGLENKISFDVFEKALNGFVKIQDKKKNILTIVDYSKQSTDERFFIIDLDKKEVLLGSVVSHGKNSGENTATSFSNNPNSHKSSLGFFLTEGTYEGSNGYSLILNGLEEGFNDNAKKRFIVIHGASYASAKFGKIQGRLGRSFGCPALPKEVYKEAIDIIKDGSVIFVYGNDKNYLERSTFI